MARYAVVDAQGQIQNVIEWDGVTEYDPGADRQLVPHEDVPAGEWIGDTVPAQVIADSAADLVLGDAAKASRADQEKVSDAEVA